MNSRGRLRADATKTLAAIEERLTEQPTPPASSLAPQCVNPNQGYQPSKASEIRRQKVRHLDNGEIWHFFRRYIRTIYEANYLISIHLFIYRLQGNRRLIT